MLLPGPRDATQRRFLALPSRGKARSVALQFRPCLDRSSAPDFFKDVYAALVATFVSCGVAPKPPLVEEPRTSLDLVCSWLGIGAFSP